MSGYLRLPPTILESMCGGGDRAERRLLTATHVSRRMAQLRALLDAAPDQVSAGYDALAVVQRQDPHTVARLLGGPQAGAWAAYTLHRLSHDGRSPLWPHLAQSGAVAAAAALRCGVEVRVPVPARAGVVSFPSVGRAVVDRPEDVTLVDCVTGPDGPLLDGAAPLAWEPVRELRVTAGEVELAVQIDELDPYWRTFGLPVADRLTDPELARWRSLLDQAWRLLVDRHTHRLGTLAAAVRCLVPVRRAGRLGGVSASAAHAPGAVALTEPVTPHHLAATLVHEAQHYRLASLHDLRPLWEPSPRLVHSPWRTDPRPVSGLVHGLVAFAAVAEFRSRERSEPADELDYARHLRQLRDAHDTVTGAPELTALGAALVDGLGTAIGDLPPDTDSAEIRRLADDLVAEHRAGWRLRNVVPDEFTLRAVVAAWQRGEEPLSGVVDHPGDPRPADPGGDHPLTRVAMAWLQDRDTVAALVPDPDAFTRRFPGAHPSDLHLLGGDHTAACRVALARIAAGTADDHTWATLTVAHGRRCPDPRRSPLVTRPELVRAAWRRVAAANDPGPLVALLARYEAGTSTSDSIRR